MIAGTGEAMRVAILTAMILAAAPADAKPTASGARAFLEGLYVSYRAEPVGTVDAVKRPALFFDPALVSAIAADDAAAAKRGEVPLLNGDPICDCQDYIPFRAAIGPVRLRGNRAEVTVRFDNGRPRVLRYSLIATRQGWRIRDIDTGDSSLRALYKLPR